MAERYRAVYAAKGVPPVLLQLLDRELNQLRTWLPRTAGAESAPA